MPSVSAMRAAARGWAVGDVQLADGGDEGLQGLVVEREGADEEARVAEGDEAEAVVLAAGDEVAEDALGNGETAFAAPGRDSHAAGGVEDEGEVEEEEPGDERQQSEQVGVGEPHGTATSSGSSAAGRPTSTIS